MGVGVKGGLEAAVHATRHTIDQLRHTEDLCILKIDFQNAFNECNRNTFLTRLESELPALFNWAYWCYYHPAQLRFGHHALLSTSRVQQGDPLGPLLFSLTLSELLKMIKIPEEVKLNTWYLDDGALIGPRPVIADILSQIQNQRKQFGLLLNKRKCEVYWPSGDQKFLEFPSEVTRLIDGVSLLGSPICGTAEYMSTCVSKLVAKAESTQEKIIGLDDPQVEMHLLRWCAGICKINHILRSVPYKDMEAPLLHFDTSLRASLSKISRSSISESSWQQANLPFRLGGIGLRKACNTANIAFLSSCLSSHSLIQKLLSLEEDEQFQVPDEREAKDTVCNEYGLDTDGEVSQSSLQAQLDDQSFTELLSRCNIRDKARLVAFADSTETSGWLRAVPIYSLGLSMTGPEFVVSFVVSS